MSTTFKQDKDDHPIIYCVMNNSLWAAMFVLVGFPFGLTSSFILVMLRPFLLLTRSTDLFELIEFLELCQYLPEMCMAHMLAGTDFIKSISGRIMLNVNAVAPI